MRLLFGTLGAALIVLAACDRIAETPADAPETETDSETRAANAAPPASAAPGRGQTQPLTARDGREFVALAAAVDLYEIEAARLAIDRAESAAVKALARDLLADHQRSTRNLARAARAAQPRLSAAGRLRPEQQALLERLRGASGAAFDEEYLRQQVEAHEQALGLMTGFMVSGDVPSLQQHAADAAEPVQRHLSRARELVERAAAPPQ